MSKASSNGIISSNECSALAALAIQTGYTASAFYELAAAKQAAENGTAKSSGNAAFSFALRSDFVCLICVSRLEDFFLTVNRLSNLAFVVSMTFWSRSNLLLKIIILEQQIISINIKNIMISIKKHRNRQMASASIGNTTCWIFGFHVAVFYTVSNQGSICLCICGSKKVSKIC